MIKKKYLIIKLRVLVEIFKIEKYLSKKNEILSFKDKQISIQSFHFRNTFRNDLDKELTHSMNTTSLNKTCPLFHAH